ncbi:kinase-like protein [Cristinia sonorae]|uniref:Kinase-like protein n=1 Tax=Cristinia sonorae TaxID=1940300 RepID=A0A8K0XSX5_9AGAR|nr:kinase-like protein [Cristinia sonorae]
MSNFGQNENRDQPEASPSKRKDSGDPSNSQYRNRERSSSPIPSPGSSEPHARRGRSRTRNPPQSQATPTKQHPDDHERQGYHALMSSFGKVFHVEQRWKLIREMGCGAYGFVISAADDISGETVAIKMVTRALERVQLAKRALREITLLRYFSHENITGLIDVDCSPNLDEMHAILLRYIFMEVPDLHQIIKSGQKLTNEHVQYFVYQILRGLKFVHSASVVHRDLKPGNLLVNADCELKICDFGLSRGFSSSPEAPSVMTEYVATRWYRAPEIMLAYRGYNTAIDMWSVGCIIAELLQGKPLFKGKDYVDQLNKILDLLGTPEEEVIKKVGSDKASAYLRSLPKRRPVSFQKLLPAADSQALDLLKQIVAFDPTARLTAAGALAHPWLSSYHDEEDEPVCPRVFDRWETLEKLETLDEYREAILKEIADCRAEVRAAAQDDLTDAGSIRSPRVMHDEIPEIPEEEDQENEPEDDKLMPMPATGSVIHSRSPTMDRRTLSPDLLRRDSYGRNHAEAAAPASDATSAGGTAVPADPMVAYGARRSSMFVPSRTNSTYSVYRVPSTTEVAGGSSIAFPTTNAPEYVVPMRSRAASSFGHGVAASEDRRRLLRTLSTVSIYETGEGLAGGLADVAPIGKYIVQRDRTEEEAIQSEMPKELAEGVSTGSDERSGRKKSGEEKKRLFTID